MSTPSAATLSLSDQAVLTVLCGLLPVDTPRELSIPQIAAAGGFLHSQVSASLDALERAGLIVRAHSSFGRAPTILRPATPLPARSDPAEAPRPAVPRRRSVPALLAAYLGGFAPGTVLSTSLHELGEAVGGFSPNKVGAELGKLELEGLVERLPGSRLKLRICGPIPSPEPEQDVLNQLSAHLSGRPLGVELGLTVEQLARGIGRSPMSVVRSLRVLEAEGYLRRTLSGRRTGLILLRPLDTVAAALPAPARPTSVPKLPAAKLPSPHALLWTHLRTTLPQRPQIDWLLSGLTTTVLADKTILTGVDVARTTFARALHRTLASALHALELPHVLVIQQTPAESGPALAPGALDAVLAAGSVSALLDAVQALPRLGEAEARALLALVQTGQVAQERQTIRKRCSAELTEAIARGSAAWERLLLSHVWVVAALARRLSSERVSLEERVQAGLLGLMEAVAQSDGRLEREFFLFACGAIERAIQDEREGVRSVRRTSSQRRAAKIQRALAASLGRAPTVGEIAQQAGMRPETVVAVLEAEAGVASLNAPLRDDEAGTLGDLIADGMAQTPEALLLAQEEAQAQRQVLSSALAGLEPDARQVIALRFGLAGPAQGVSEVARELGWTVPQVRRVEAGALATLRERMVGGGEAGC